MKALTMRGTARRLAVSLGLAGLLASPAALAGLGDDAIAGGGEILVTFVSSEANYNSLILVNSGVPFFPNHTTAPGDTVSIGTFAAGTILDFALMVTTTGQTFHTGPASGNPDSLIHADVTYDFGTPGTTRVSFEDVLGGGDMDYDDYIFTFRSVTAIPEPATNVLMLAGLMAVAWLSRRRKSTRF
jgi:hypothetical protein